MVKATIQALRMLIVLTVITGVLYPVVVTLAAGVVFPAQANGNIISVNGQAVGSSLIGQPFTTDRYFQGRPSGSGYYGYGVDAVKDAAGTPVPDQYGFAASSGTNAGPTNSGLHDAIIARADAFRQLNGLAADAAVPPDMLTASASGLDPHISPESARLQAARVARVRNLDAAKVTALVDRYTEGPQLAIFGQPRVNVLSLNLALDRGEAN